MEVNNLVSTIEQSIAIRGVYLLLDESLDLICGPKITQSIDDPVMRERIGKFSAAHGWSVVRRETGFLFLPRTGEIDFNDF
jgi:hypothetical protein